MLYSSIISLPSRKMTAYGRCTNAELGKDFGFKKQGNGFMVSEA